ncbi:MAG TPA: hypothetical protein H9912_05380, partial [Candidatus Eisenbergiella stercorigallinarum]|nr:hypothetical protein [Candidatus Eisenbergiella stercorigallinarum]
MADNKEARDEKLIEELYERLWWYTHEASDEEFDEKEVDAITRLLDVLEPVHDDQAFASGADAALKRFWERYGEEEEDAGLAEAAGASDAASPDLPGKDTVPPCPSPNRSGWKKRFLRLGIGLAACAVLLVSVNIGCYALKKKSFFEIVREEVGRTEITVTGNVEDKNDNIECSSWEEVEKIVGEKLLKPTYLPTGYAVKSIIIQSLRPVGIIVGRYEDNEGHYLRVEIDIYDESYTKSAFYYDKDWELLEEDGDLGILY